VSKEGTATLGRERAGIRWIDVARKLGDGRGKSPKGKLFGEVGERTGAVGTQLPTH
jgi:hypothetical protein